MIKKITPKLIFSDMEGTLFQKAVPLDKTKVAPSAWYAIAESLGQDAVKEEIGTQEKYNGGEYSSYIEWMENTIMIHKRYRLSRTKFIDILDRIQYTPGAKEVFSVINDLGIPTCLISGGFKYQANKAIRDLGIKHAFVACEYFWDEAGFLECWNLLPGDYRGKLEFMKLLISEYGFSPEECAFIGDGNNDIELAKAVGVSIAFNASEGLKDITTYSISQAKEEENFGPVLDHLNLKRL